MYGRIILAARQPLDLPAKAVWRVHSWQKSNSDNIAAPMLKALGS
jgi:hypothetical protein